MSILYMKYIYAIPQFALWHMLHLHFRRSYCTSYIYCCRLRCIFMRRKIYSTESPELHSLRVRAKLDQIKKHLEYDSLTAREGVKKAISYYFSPYFLSLNVLGFKCELCSGS